MKKREHYKFIQAANQAKEYTQFQIGQMYEEGRGVEKNEKKAIEKYVNLINKGRYSKRYKEYLERLKKMLQKESGEEDWIQILTDAYAQIQLGQMYLKGRGVKKDEKKAAQLYEKAANQGYKEAQFQIGQMYEEGRGVERNEKKAIEVYANLVNKGWFGVKRECLGRLEKMTQKQSEEEDWTQLITNADAQYKLGEIYEEGREVEKNEKKAIELYEKAANQGNPKAQYKLGKMYEEGRGVKKDAKKAAELYEKAANQEYDYAQFQIGQMYEEGRGVERNEKKAIQVYAHLINKRYFVWFEVYGKCLERLEKMPQKECEEGDWTQLITNAFAQCELGKKYLCGRGVVKDEKKAAELYEKAANQGNIYAQYELGKMYEEGRGVEKNEKKAIKLYEKAANQGNTGAHIQLGQMYEEGRGAEKNEKKAIEKYVSLINKGRSSKRYKESLERLKKMLQKESEEEDWIQILTDAYAQIQLGQMYLEGRGVKKDEKKAAQLYEKAANQANKEAQFQLAQIYEKGRGVDKDENKAAQLYEKAANQGNRDALYCLGRMVYQGTGVQKEETNTFQLCMNRAQEHYFNIPVFDSSEREEIGRGSCGVVWRIQGRTRDGRKIHVAVKQLKTNDKSKALWQEVQAMLKVPSNNNVVQLYGASVEKLEVVMEYCNMGSFRSEIEKHYHNNTTIKTKLLHECLKQVSWGMVHLHKNEVIHRDLALRNVLWSTKSSWDGSLEYCFKVSDFGMSRVVEDSSSVYNDELTAMPSQTKHQTQSSLYTWRGTDGVPVRWMPPECLEQLAQGKVQYSKEADVWSFGVVLWEMYCGEVPFYKIRTNEQVIEQVVEHNKRLERPEFCKEEIWAVAEACFQKANKRPNFRKISFTIILGTMKTEKSEEIPICIHSEYCPTLREPKQGDGSFGQHYT